MAGSLEPLSIAPLRQQFKKQPKGNRRGTETTAVGGGETKGETTSETKENSTSTTTSAPSSSSASLLGSGEEQLSTDLSLVRHHYMKSLQGIPLRDAEDLQSAFIDLYTALFATMDRITSTPTTKEAHSARNALISTCFWCWCLDYQPLDFEFLLRIGLPTMLGKFMAVGVGQMGGMGRIGALYQWVVLCSVGGRKGFYNGCMDRKRMMKRAIKESVAAARLDLVEPSVRFRSAVVDGERVKSLPGILVEPEEGADECLKMSLYLQSTLMDMLQSTLVASSDMIAKRVRVVGCCCWWWWFAGCLLVVADCFVVFLVPFSPSDVQDRPNVFKSVGEGRRKVPPSFNVYVEYFVSDELPNAFEAVFLHQSGLSFVRGCVSPSYSVRWCWLWWLCWWLWWWVNVADSVVLIVLPMQHIDACVVGLVDFSIGVDQGSLDGMVKTTRRRTTTAATRRRRQW